MNYLDQLIPAGLSSDEASWPLLICLLGSFLLLQAGQTVAIHGGGKIETLLCRLGLQSGRHVPRAALVNLLWPASDSAQATQSLNSLVYSLHKLIGDALGGAAPVLHEDGYYRLNLEAGVGVDIACFDAWANTGDQQVRAGDLVGAAISYRQSIHCIAATWLWRRMSGAFWSASACGPAF